MPVPVADPYERLAMSILGQAVFETRRGGEKAADARAWLLDGGLFFCDGLGLEVDPGWWKDWIAKNCPPDGKGGTRLWH